MSTQETLYGLGNSLTNKKFKFVLSTKEESLTLRFAPQGWNDSEITFIRDPQYKGVVESYSTSELTFVKDGRDFIQNYYEKGGVDYTVNIKIYILDNATFKYNLYYSGKLDLSTYKVDSLGVTCKIIASGFQDLVLNRDDIDVDMMSTKYIGGGENSMEHLVNVWERVTIPNYSATQNGDWTIWGEVQEVTSGQKYYNLPMELTSSEFGFDETLTQVLEPYPHSAPPTQKFFDADDDYTFNLRVSIEVIYEGFASGTWDTTIRIFKNNTPLLAYADSETGNQSFQQFDIDETISVVAGDTLSIAADTNGTAGYSLVFNGFTASISRELDTDLTEVNVPMFYIYEAFVRTLQMITGNSMPFYSNFLGRTDSVTETYYEDGEGALMAITNGLWIRGFNPNINGLNFNLKDLFKTINSIWNVGLGFEIIDGKQKVRVEDEKYFFDIQENADVATDGKYWRTNQILDLSEHLNDEVISKEVLPDWYANQVNGGYGSFEYENIQGLKEFNTASSWAIPIKSVKGTLDVKSPYRADTQGVNKLRAKPIETNPTEDVNGDKDNFVFDVKRGGTYEFTVKTDDDFDLVSGGIDPAECYNLNFTPRRNLERHGSRMYTMVDSRTTPSSSRPEIGVELDWLKSDKNTSLVTIKTGETESKAENADIPIKDLDKGYWIPEAYVFESPVDEDTIAAIQANPRGVIKIGENKYGWILEVQSNNDDKKGEFKLLRCDLGNVLVLVPPDEDYELEFDETKNTLYVPLIT